MSSTTVWSRLSRGTQQELLQEYSDGRSIENLALRYGLKASSLSRKMREIKSRNSSSDKHSKSVRYLFTDKEMKVMVYSDTHFPRADPLALECALMIRDLYEPDIIINLGDTLDMHHLSRFAKVGGRRETLQEEIDSWRTWASRMYDGFNGEAFILRGNHDARIERVLGGIDGLSDLGATTLDNLLGVSEFGCESVCDVLVVNPRGDDVYPDGQMYFYHGDSARKGSGNSARFLSVSLSGASVMVGHAHRTALVASRTQRGIARSYEVGCLASMNVDWSLYPDWSQSVMVGVLSDEVCEFTPVLIDRGSFMYGGVIRRANAAP